MDRKLWMEKLKEAIEMIQEPAVHNLLKKDEEYQKNSRAIEYYEAEYQRLEKTLGDDEKEIIQGLLDSRDSADLDYSVWSFVVGVQMGCWLKELLFQSGK